MKREFENVKTEDQSFNPKEFGLRDDLKEDNTRDEYANIDTDPIAEFLEYCALCSSQKELDEAEEGVSNKKKL
ncbi:MAG: hypothetical protein JSY10_29595 [Paenibacillus sp.]|nr:hypothetical protein [Paenibacillus sp.]MBM6388055.1 hypothetical protein [Paenibacillus sp.]